MDWINLISMIFGILSFFATISISFVIYFLEKRTRIREHRKELKQQAHDFLLENIDEKEYLPLAQFSARLNPLYKHKRSIYNRFSRCNVELQKEILKEAHFADLELEKYDDDFCNKMLNMYEQDAQNMKLLTQTFLYDGAKYFFRGLKSHGNIKLCGNLEEDIANNEPKSNYLPQDLYHINNNYYQSIVENEIWLRLLDYSLLQNNEMDEEKFKNIKRFENIDTLRKESQSKYLYVMPDTFSEFKKIHKIPPLDYYWILNSNTDESECVYIVMEMVRQGCFLINRELNKEWLNPFEGEYEIERNEDLFYSAMQTLYCTYAQKLVKKRK